MCWVGKGYFVGCVGLVRNVLLAVWGQSGMSFWMCGVSTGCLPCWICWVGKGCHVGCVGLVLDVLGCGGC